MTSEGAVRPLGEVISLVSGNTPSKSNLEYWGGTVPWVSAKDMADFWLVDSEDHLTPAGVAAASRVVPKGSVLMLVRGMTLHKRVPICRVAAAVTFNQDVKAVLPKPGLSRRFLPYLLAGNHDRLLARVDSAGHGTGRLNTDTIVNLEVWVPCVVEQDQIADLAEAIDERIALLRETNATLEAIAQALFKSWFVDFDPVRAKRDGRAPEGMDEATAALFPDSFEASALGEVPRGWQASSLAALTARSGGSIQTGPFGSQLHASDYVADGVPVVMPKDISLRRVQTDSIARVPASDVERLGKHKLLPGDIVFSRRGDVERHALISGTERGWLCGTGCLLVRPGKTWPSPTFLSMLLDAPQSRTWLVQHAVGATMPNLNTGILGSVPVVLPPSELLLAFEDVVSALETSRAENSERTRTLSTLRDTLLPRLISGQLRLPESKVSLIEMSA